MIITNKNFSYRKFAQKFGINECDVFVTADNVLLTDNLSDLQDADIADCYTTQTEIVKLEQASREIAVGVTDAAKLDALWELAINGNAEKVDALKVKLAKIQK